MGVPVAGLARDSDGRWRVLATGKRFTEPDERRAVARYYEETRAARVLRFTTPVADGGVQVVNGRAVRRSSSLIAMHRFARSLMTDSPLTVLLDEATSDDTLIRFRTELVNDPELNSTDTVAAYLARVRGVIRIAGRGDLDAVQITRAVERCKAKLYA